MGLGVELYTVCEIKAMIWTWLAFLLLEVNLNELFYYLKWSES